MGYRPIAHGARGYWDQNAALMIDHWLDFTTIVTLHKYVLEEEKQFPMSTPFFMGVPSNTPRIPYP